MITSLVEKAVALFVETLPLGSMSVDHPEFHHLYSQECKLFGVMRVMSEEEMSEYRRRVRVIQPEDGE